MNKHTMYGFKKDDSSHKRVFPGFRISKTNKLFCFFFNQEEENIGLLFILPSKDILINLISITIHKIIGPLTSAKQEGYGHRIKDSLSRERIIGTLNGVLVVHYKVPLWLVQAQNSKLQSLDHSWNHWKG